MFRYRHTDVRAKAQHISIAYLVGLEQILISQGNLLNLSLDRLRVHWVAIQNIIKHFSQGLLALQAQGQPTLVTSKKFTDRTTPETGKNYSTWLTLSPNSRTTRPALTMGF